MRFPIPLGAAAYGEASPGPTRFRRVLRRLQGRGAYSTDPDSARDNELGAIGTILAIGSQAIYRAALQAFPNKATQLLDEWERVYRLPRLGGSDTDAARQLRLVAAERATGGASEVRYETAVQTVSPTAVIERNTIAMIDADDEWNGVAGDEQSPVPGTYQGAVRIPDYVFDDQQKRRHVGEILARILPARSFGQLSKPDPAQLIYTDADAEWNLKDSRLGRTALRQQTGTDYDEHDTPWGGRARHRIYAARSRLDAADLNAIQDKYLVGPSEGVTDADAFASSGIGGDWLAFACKADQLNSFSLDASRDWRDRMINVCLMHDTADIRPGSTGDGSFGSGTDFSTCFYSGAGGVAYSVEILTGLSISVHTTAGNLIVDNTTGTDYYMAGMLYASGDTGSR